VFQENNRFRHSDTFVSLALTRWTDNPSHSCALCGCCVGRILHIFALLPEQQAMQNGQESYCCAKLQLMDPPLNDVSVLLR